MRSISDRVMEALTQVLVGTLLIYLSNKVFFALQDIEVTRAQNTALVIINTCIAFIKTYSIREFFERVANKQQRKHHVEI